jgi:two-component system, NtrC family, sensor kinase
MRWGILINLALILVVSGALLFVVFGASLERSAIDDKVLQAKVIADLLESRIASTATQEALWETVRSVCTSGAALRIAVYDNQGKIMGGCGTQGEAQKPAPAGEGRKIYVIGNAWPSDLFHGLTVVVDVVRPFPHGIRSVRAFLDIPPSVFAPAWKFFAGYLVLTQAALFFLGYILFYRTVIGPIRAVAEVASQAAGKADSRALSNTIHLKGDIQRISASLRAMLQKIVEDREAMAALIEQLRTVNRDLEVAQQGLIRSEKLAGVGRLAAGLAHEIGNPLQIIMGYAELLRRAPVSQPNSEILDRMDQEMKRIHEILQRLLEFASPTRKVVASCDLNAVVQDCGSLVRGRKGFRNVEFEYVLDPELSCIDTEPEKIRQVLVNLIFNAADAIPESGGKIILRTRKADDSVEIQVEDTGAGIPEDDREKIFDPFFTTKEPGKGTGLGLAVCLGLVESLGGSIDVESQEETGTVVTVRLPGGDPSGGARRP